MVNVRASRLASQEQIANPESDLFALQTDAKDFTKNQITAGLWNENKGTIKTWLKPQTTKLVYDLSRIEELDPMQIRGMAAIKEEQAIYKQDALNTV